jgi:hypothetical protein
MIAQIEHRTTGHELLFKRLTSVLNFLNEESIESNGQHDLPIYEHVAEGIVERELGDPRITYVSDCAIISTDPTFDGLKSICNKITKLSTDLACDGMFIRGAIAYGPLYHDKKFVFGGAYQQAYETESKLAVFPRVIFDESVLSQMASSIGQFPLNDFGTRIDTDAKRYLHCFPWQYHPGYTFDWLNFLLRVKGHLLFSLNSFDDRVTGFPSALRELDRYYCWRELLGSNPEFTGSDDRILKKFVWLKDEFNRTLEQHANFLSNHLGQCRISKIVDHGTHWGPERMLGRIR